MTARDLIGIWPLDRRVSTGGKSSPYGVINEPGAAVVFDWNVASSSFALQVDSAYSSALGVGEIRCSIGGMTPIGAGQGLLKHSVRTTTSTMLMARGDEEGTMVGVQVGIPRE